MLMEGKVVITLTNTNEGTIEVEKFYYGAKVEDINSIFQDGIIVNGNHNSILIFDDVETANNYLKMTLTNYVLIEIDPEFLDVASINPDNDHIGSVGIYRYSGNIKAFALHLID